MFYLILIILLVIAAVLLCFVVLIQNSKGGGLAAGFSSSNAILGVRKATDILDKLTWGLAIFIVVVSIISAWAIPSQVGKGSAIQQQALEEAGTNPYDLPAGTAAPFTESQNTGDAE